MSTLLGYALIAVLLVGVGLTGWVAALGHRRGRVDGRLWFVLSVLIGGWWITFMLVNLFVGDREVTVVLNTFEMIGAVILPLSWLGFALAYTGRRRVIRGPVFSALTVVPAVTVGILLAELVMGLGMVRNDLWLIEVNGVFVTGVDHGLWWVGQLTYSYLVLAVGLVAIVEPAFDGQPTYQRQVLLLGVATILPMAASLVSFVGVPTLVGADITPLSLTLSIGVLAVAIDRHRLLHTAPIPTRIAHHAILESLETPLVVLNHANEVVHANPRAIDAFGATSSLTGLAVEDLPGVRRLTPEGPVTDSVIEHSTERGRSVYHLRETPLEDANGRRYGTIILYQDLTDVRLREQRIEVMHRVLRHDIRTEMTVALGKAREALAGQLDAEAALESIETTARSVVDTSETAREIEHLIDVAAAVEPAGTVAEPLETVRERVGGSHPAANLELDVDVPTGTIVPVGFEAVLWHLVDNGIRHNPSTAPTVSVAISAAEEGWLACEVTDDGPGIPEAELAVFEHGRVTALEHASGLGLWLVHWVVTEFGGEVHVGATESGTSITVTVPEPEMSQTGE